MLAQLFVRPTSESDLETELAEIYNFIYITFGCVCGVENRVTFWSDRFPDPVHCVAALTFDKIMEWFVWVDRSRVPRRGRGWLTGSDSTVT